jgi:hypothetical protein
MAVIPHPPHSPDLTPCDFFLFPNMKLKLEICRFGTVEEIQAESQRVLDTDRKGLPGTVTIHLIERRELVSRETSVTLCIAVRREDIVGKNYTGTERKRTVEGGDQ